MITLLASVARVASGTSVVANLQHLERVLAADFQLNVSAAAAAGGDTLNVYVQHSVDEGTTWDDFVSFTQVLGNGGAKKFLAEWRADVSPESELHVPADGSLAAGVLQGPKGSAWRVKWTFVGGTAAFTFELKAQIKRMR